MRRSILAVLAVLPAAPGALAQGGPPERFAAHVAAEIARWRGVVEANRIERIAE